VNIIPGILDILLIVLLYGCIWFVPITINNKRRKQGKPPYWLLFTFSLLLELAIVYLVLIVAKLVSLETTGLYLAPIIAALVAGWFYILTANRLDSRSDSTTATL
jgi:hypothetical protein